MNRRDALIARVTQGYREAFGAEPEALFAAPGRVNLIGEHVDYNDGLVLPCAIDRETIVAIGAGGGGLIEAVALDMGAGARDAFDPAAPIARGPDDWHNNLRGVAHFLGEYGHPVCPARIAVAGDVPIGAGLSSSASFGVALALALSEYSGHALAPDRLALIAQAAENDFVGCACGIMDQMASAASTAGAALLLDCRTLATRSVPVHPGLAITVIDSGIRRQLTESAFNERRDECEAAARHFGVAALRDLDPAMLEAGRGGLDSVLYARARHVVSEIARVEPVAAALASGDSAALARLLAQGHRSLAQDFAVSLPALDRLAELVQAPLGDAGGVRLTGAGFGGCLVTVSDAAAGEAIAGAVSCYNREAAIPARFEVFKPGAGAVRIPL
ncbi:galactokinase [Erythrobacter dokdonensis]|uniref:Galactokinase n=1 Tax=Erythrobacter dokdonensis DSW-74 TaxID=1300349 RepID=A0A1A7BEI2_9SPHN|nr:galactokinase [Erythrobacter dokdonensis]OBV10166.1 Galactokinase [Erythrobacter dokdonensis DSW-74]